MPNSTTTCRILAPALLLVSGVLALACATEPKAPVITPAMAQSIATLNVPNMTQPTDDLLCSGQLSPEQMDGLKAAGVASFVSLRLATEKGAGWEERHAAAMSIDFRRMPVAGAGGVDESAARSLAKILEEAPKPTVLYCGSSNRVGALLALRAFHVDGQSAESALAVGKSSGLTKLEPLARKKLGL